MISNFKTIFKSFVKTTDGATAVEFSLVAIPFTFLLMGIIEISLFFAASNIMHGATSDAGRLVRTGQVQQYDQGDPQVLFETALCEHASVFANCDNIEYEVIAIDGFSDFSSHAAQYDEDGNFQPQGFTPGGTNDTVLIRTNYRYKFMVPFLASMFSDGSDGGRAILTTIVLQTEPYDLDDESGET